MSSTALTLKEVPGWYIEFQAALLRQAPRPGEIDQTTAESWTSNQKSLKKNLTSCLLPPVLTRNWREEDGVIYSYIRRRNDGRELLRSCGSGDTRGNNHRSRR